MRQFILPALVPARAGIQFPANTHDSVHSEHMLNAIGAPDSSNATGIGSLTAGLEAQLARYQRELSNCVNCDTANTREGRETIQALSNKINALKSRIEAIANTKVGIQSATPNADDRRINNAIAPDKTSADSSSVSQAVHTTLGSRLDTFA